MKIKLLLLIGLCLNFNAFAQEMCGFDAFQKKFLSTPENVKKYNETQQSINNIMASQSTTSNKTTAALYTIPVVVHIIDPNINGAWAARPTDAQIITAIDNLNKTFDGTYPGLIPPVGSTSKVDMQIKFELAKRTPSCGFTNGIDRVDASGLPNYAANGVGTYQGDFGGCPDILMKNLARWDPTQYYNIYLVDKFSNNLGGWASFASSHGSPTDGATITASGFILPLAGPGVNASSILAPHELGHAFDLYHTWEGGNTTICPPNITCSTEGDQCCDIDPVTQGTSSGRIGSNNLCTIGNLPYTVNSEHNIMAYAISTPTHLFTSDQKARALAACAGPRASFNTSLAAVPCGPEINFQLASSLITENTDVTVGCRKFKDYTYKMTIGNTASANATATITFSGTATQGLDYDVTTNGNFNAPSNNITFPLNSVSTQNFTVRIYDDANVETAETIILDFTLNSGAGNATKGTTIPTMTININDNEMAPLGTSTGIYSLGTPTFTTNRILNANQSKIKSQILYTANELTAAGLNAGNLTSLALHIQSKNSSTPFSGFSINMANTSNTVSFLSVNNATNPVHLADFTTVYSSNVTTTLNWNTFNLPTPFYWDGISNLCIELCWDNGTANTGIDNVSTYLPGNGSNSTHINFLSIYNKDCSHNMAFQWNYTFSGNKPVIRLGQSIVGTPIETAVSSTSANYITDNSNDYFYSNNNKLLMKLENISSTLDCVNTVLDEAGTTWSNATSLGTGLTRSAKVFSVTPTTNSTTTNYDISLYFENAELGGKNANTIMIAKTNAANASAADLSNTVSLQTTFTTLGSGTTVFTGSATGFSRFFLIDGALAPLAITLTDFTAIANKQKNTLVSWTTSSEQNNKEFTLEISRDGTNFISLTTIPSKGNSTSPQHYEYLHIKPSIGKTYYRLRHTSLDGSSTISKTVVVDISDEPTTTFLYPVPVKDVLTINFEDIHNDFLLEVYSIDMRLSYREYINNFSKQKTLDVSKLQPGLYFVRIVKKSGIELLRFIKE